MGKRERAEEGSLGMREGGEGRGGGICDGVSGNIVKLKAISAIR